MAEVRCRKYRLFACLDDRGLCSRFLYSSCYNNSIADAVHDETLQHFTVNAASISLGMIQSLILVQAVCFILEITLKRRGQDSDSDALSSSITTEILLVIMFI